MKHLFVTVFLLSATMLKAQDVISLKSGETVSGKVVEVGITELKYYKASNQNGPAYVTAKSDVSQITYANGTKDVFNTSAQSAPTSTSPNVVVAPTRQQVVVVERPARRGWPYVPYPLFIPHIDVGHHIDLGHHDYGHYSGGHH